MNNNRAPSPMLCSAPASNKIAASTAPRRGSSQSRRRARSHRRDKSGRLIDNAKASGAIQQRILIA